MASPDLSSRFTSISIWGDRKSRMIMIPLIYSNFKLSNRDFDKGCDDFNFKWVGDYNLLVRVKIAESRLMECNNGNNA